MSIHFATVGLYDSSDAIETKTVMALTDFSKRLRPQLSAVTSELAFGSSTVKRNWPFSHFDKPQQHRPCRECAERALAKSSVSASCKS